MANETKQTERVVPGIGTIPEGWDVTRVRNLFTEISERYDSHTNRPLPLLSVSEYYGVAERADKIEENEVLVRAATLDGYKKCRTGDLVSNIMLTWKGALGISPKDGIVSPAYCVYRPAENICGKYYHYLFRTQRYADIFRTYSTGLIDSRLRLYSPKFYSIMVPHPPLDVQEKIANHLDKLCDKIDEIITEAKASIEEYKAWKSSIIYEAVTKGLNLTAEMKDSGVEWIGKVPASWKVIRLKFLLNFPLQYGANEVGQSYDPTLPRYIRITDISMDGILKSEGKQSLPEEASANYLLADGDILLARSGATVGKSFFYQGAYGRAAFAGYLIRAKINKDVADPKFIYYTTLSAGYETWKNTVLIQSTIQNISASKYNEYTISLPPLVEQQNIVAFLDRKCSVIASLIKEKESLISDLESYKKSLIYEVVTGKRKVV